MILADNESQNVVQKPWRLEFCPECGYALEGSPDAGVCPECGSTYDKAEVILTGWGRGAHANLLTAKWKNLLPVGLLFFWIFYDKVSNIRRQPLGSLNLFWMGWLFLSIAMTLIMRFSNTKPGLCQVRLSSDGCSQTENPDANDSPFELIFWLYTPAYSVMAAVLYCIQGENHLLGIGLVCFAFMFFAAMLIGYCRKRLRVKAQPTSKVKQAQLTPWKAIGSILVKPASKECFRIRVRLIDPAWRFKIDPVDAEVHCTREQAVQLNFMIENWRGRRA